MITEDVVGIFDSASNQIISSAAIVRATVKESAKAMEHPVESGSTIIDHRIILPIEIELSIILRPEDYKNAYLQLRKFFLEADLLTVQTRSGRYGRMLVVAMPHDESPDFYDTIVMAVSLREAKILRTAYGEPSLSASQVKSQKDSSTVTNGQVTTKKSALLDLGISAKNFISGFFGK